ncbi:MAG TPA: hypothetical protein V6D29_00970 [Leptolyngbyaceae cyanobacterium]
MAIRRRLVMLQPYPACSQLGSPVLPPSAVDGKTETDERVIPLLQRSVSYIEDLLGDG